MKHVNVLISGLGPTGTVLAGLLGRRGVRVAVFDRMPGLFPLPRAIGFDHEVMRIVQEFGAAEPIQPHIAPYRPSVYQGVDGQPIKRIDAMSPPYPLGWAPNYVFTQPGFEGALREVLTSTENVEIHCSTEVVAVGQDANGAWVDARSADVPEVQRFTGDYLIACDGGSSPIRKALGAELEDLGFHQRWLTIDALVDDDKLPDLPQTQIQFCNATRPGSYVVGPKNHRRWELQLLPSESQRKEFSDEEVWSFLERWIQPDHARLWRSAIYDFRGLVAREWRHERILLAGDAAHMTPPFMAQGMCQGMRDALNLAWKLERVVKGVSPDTLLDSYMEERRPHVLQTTRSSIELGRLICETDMPAALARDQRLRDEQGGTIKTVTRQQMIPNLQQGLCAFDTAGAGEIFPQPEVTRQDFAGRLDDLTGGTVRVVVRGPMNETEEAKYLDALRTTGGVLVHLDGVARSSGVLAIHELHPLVCDWLEARDSTVVVVRPDHYVYGTARDHISALQVLNLMNHELGI